MNVLLVQNYLHLLNYLKDINNSHSGITILLTLEMCMFVVSVK